MSQAEDLLRQDRLVSIQHASSPPAAVSQERFLPRRYEVNEA